MLVIPKSKCLLSPIFDLYKILMTCRKIFGLSSKSQIWFRGFRHDLVQEIFLSFPPLFEYKYCSLRQHISKVIIGSHIWLLAMEWQIICIRINFAALSLLILSILWFSGEEFWILDTAWKVSVFGVFLVHIFSHLDWFIQFEWGKIRIRKTPNTDTFQEVLQPFLLCDVSI